MFISDIMETLKGHTKLSNNLIIVIRHNYGRLSPDIMFKLGDRKF